MNHLLASFTFSIPEMLGILGLMGAIVGVWIDARLRIQALEVRMTELRKDVDDHCAANDTTFDGVVRELKEITKEVHATQNKFIQEMNDGQSALTKDINELRVLVAEFHSKTIMIQNNND